MRVWAPPNTWFLSPPEYTSLTASRSVQFIDLQCRRLLQSNNNELHHLRESVGVWTTENATVDAQLVTLKTALTIATILDRVLILRRFHCRRKSTGDFVDCPLDSLLRLTAFDAGFAERYCDSSFLRRPLVPDAVRRGISARYFISTTTGNTAASPAHRHDGRCTSKLAATLRWFTSGGAIRIAVRQLSQTWKLRHYDVIDDVITRKV